MRQLTMDSFEVQKVRVDGQNLAVVTHFGDDPEHHESWLFLALGWNRDSRKAAARWVGHKVYTLAYYRHSAQRLNEIAEFVRRTKNRSTGSSRYENQRPARRHRF